jgi:hypothetical protein
MDADDFHMCEQMLPRLEAKAQLLSIAAAGYPHSKKAWQDRYHRSMTDLARPTPESTGPELSLGDLARTLGRR